MVLSCVAFGCKNEWDPRKLFSFHTFPFKRPKELEKWVRALKWENWKPTKHSRLCSAHFLESDYETRPNDSGPKHLKKDAVPSIFNFPPHLLKKKTVARRCIKRSPEPSSHKMSQIGSGSTEIDDNIEIPSKIIKLDNLQNSHHKKENSVALQISPSVEIGSGSSEIDDNIEIPSKIIKLNNLQNSHHKKENSVALQTSPSVEIGSGSSDVDHNIEIPSKIIKLNNLQNGDKKKENSVAIQTSPVRTPSKKELNRKLRTLQQKVRRRNAKISNMKHYIKKLKEDGKNKNKALLIHENNETLQTDSDSSLDILWPSLPPRTKEKTINANPAVETDDEDDQIQIDKDIHTGTSNEALNNSTVLISKNKKLKTELEEVLETNRKLEITRKETQETIAVLKNRLNNLNRINEKQLKLLQNVVDGISNNVVNECYNGITSIESELDYEQRKFAFTLYLLSPKAYSHLRTQLQNSLPHPKIVSSWCKSSTEKPEINAQALKAISIYLNNKPVLPSIETVLEMDTEYTEP